MRSENKFWQKLRSPGLRSRTTGVDDAKSDASGHNSRHSSTHPFQNASAKGDLTLQELAEVLAATSDGPSLQSSLHTVSSDSDYNFDVDSYFSGTTGSPGTAPTSCRYSDGAIKSVNSQLGIPVSEDTFWELQRRIDSAYDRIRALPSPFPPHVVSQLSSDTRTLRKQLGVPQHSVINVPIESFPPLPNPHVGSCSRPLSSCGTPKYSHADLQRAVPSPQTHPEVSSGPPGERLSSPNEPTLHIDADVHDRNRAAVTQRSRKTPVLVAVAGDTDQSAAHSLPQRNLGACATTPLQNQAFQSKPRRPPKRRSVSHGLSFLTSSSHAVPKHGRVAKTVEVDGGAGGSKLQGSLPPVRGSSPFRVNVSLHQPWHERQATFELSDGRIPASVSFPEAQLRRAAVSTDVLASLAWIGAPTVSGFSSISPLGEAQNCDATDNGRYSITIAVEDENLTDEILVDQLENFRRSCSLSEHGPQRASRSTTTNHSSSLPPNNPTKLDVASWLSRPSTSLQHANLRGPMSTSLSPDEDDVVWQAARKALLCIREIVRTEKKYQEALRMLFDAQTITPPPPLMLSFIPSLIRASEMLLKGFLDDPSAWGVSTTFMACEDDVEAAMTSWCSVAGTFFTDDNETMSGTQVARWRRRRFSMNPSGSRGSISGVPLPTERIPQRSPRSPSILTSMSVADNRIVPEERQRIGEGWWLTRGMNDPQSPNVPNMIVSTERKMVPINEVETKNTQFIRRSSVRDLAIQPTQRVMRYVLLYRDLLQCTPSTSPSRPLVERALEAATRIANKCDGAQGNAAFLRSP